MAAICSAPIQIDFKVLKYKSNAELTLIEPKKCKNCPFKAITNLLFLRHYAIGELHCNRLKCDECHTFYGNLDSLRKHLNVDHFSSMNIIWFTCQFCDYITKNRSSIKRHVFAMHSTEEEKQEKWLKCKNCDYLAPHISRLTQHITRRHQVKNAIEWFHCQTCDYKTNIKLDIERHSRRQHSENIKVSCKICDAVVRKFYLRTHMLEMHGQKNERYSCEHCDYKAKRSTTLRHHIAVNHYTEEEKDRKWYKCEHCDYKSPVPSTTQKHMFRRHFDKASLDWVKCEHCKYKTKIKMDLAKHIEIQHTTTPKVNCSLCKALVKKSYMKMHMAKLHSKHKGPLQQSELKCEFCKYKTIVVDNMKKHLVAKHLTEEEKQQQWYKCDFCEYKAALSHRTKEHMFRKHHDKGNLEWIQCGDCDYKTKIRGDLVKHTEKIHTATRNVNCSICNVLVKKYYLKQHIKKLHGSGVDGIGKK